MHRCKATMRGTKYTNSTINIYYLEILEKHQWCEIPVQSIPNHNTCLPTNIILELTEHIMST